MSAAAARARLAQNARALAVARGGWRAAALARVREGRVAPTFVDLIDAPNWLRWPAPDRARLAHAAACAHLAPRIARTLDGAVLGALAALAGASTLGWAAILGEGIDFAPALTRAEATALRGIGDAILVAALPEAIAAEIAPLFAPDRKIAPEAAARALALALEAWPTHHALGVGG